MVFLSVAVLACTLATYFFLHNTSNTDPNIALILILLVLSLVLTTTIFATRKLLIKRAALRLAPGGSKLQTRVILMFSLVSALPTITISVFSALFFNYGVESWFDSRVSTAIESSIAVANSYLAEHTEVIRRDVQLMAREIDSKLFAIIRDPELANHFLSSQADLRSLTEAFLLHKNQIIAKTNLSFALSLSKLPIDAEEKVKKGEIVVISSENENKVRALVRLETIPDTYLIVGRFIDSKVLINIKDTKIAVQEYQKRKEEISDSKIIFSLVFGIVSLFLLLVVICIGIVFANSVANPLRKLVNAAEGIKAGDLTVRVEDSATDDEITALARAFNLMTEQLERQRDSLTSAYHELDAKRHFSETVLSGVSAGVIALGPNKQVTLLNRSATLLLNLDSAPTPGLEFKSICPEMYELLEQVEQRPEQPAQGEVSIIRNRKKLMLLVRIIADTMDTSLAGYVITFDDVTALVIAERTSAWADVARRVAHEIKNPLTPIHLAAERIKKKYSKEVADVETLVKYTDTIIRHVTDINKMVEEFVNFARLPSPVFEKCNIVELINSSVFSRQCLNNGIEFQIDLPNKPAFISCDISQINQALINLLKNAEESIEVRNNQTAPGIIKVTVIETSSELSILITDNGKGFEEAVFHRLTEPYITTRAKGSGLGLAIVKKIMDDHNAIITFDNNHGNGATIKITLPIKTENAINEIKVG